MSTVYDKQINVKLTQPGFSAYNGYLRKHQFIDGQSVGKIPVRMALLLGASCSCIDSDTGVALSPNTYVFESDGVGEVSASDFPSVVFSRQSDLDEAAANILVHEHADALSDSPADGPEDNDVGFHEPGAEHNDPRIWTRAELEAIADDDGIAGLREVGDILQVKGRSIEELMTAIMTKQISEPFPTDQE